MEFLVVSIAVLLALVVTAGVMDFKARRRRRRIVVGATGALDDVRVSEAAAQQRMNSPGYPAGGSGTG